MPEKRSIFWPVVLSFLVLLITGCASSGKGQPDLMIPVKKTDLVLVHGLSNMYGWSGEFLSQCANIWGAGNVYAVYTDASDRIWEREINGATIICCGDDTYAAGDDDIATQSKRLDNAVEKLQADYGLSRPFAIIAHSMGGLVARHYIHHHPDQTAALVTLATPHHGSPLARSFWWMGFFIGAQDAVDNLTPDYLEAFNRWYPVPDRSPAAACRIYTISGDSDGFDSFGWGGELFLGCPVLRMFYGTENDGIVATAATKIDGAQHIAHFPEFDHYDLVRRPEVAVKAAEYLP